MCSFATSVLANASRGVLTHKRVIQERCENCDYDVSDSIDCLSLLDPLFASCEMRWMSGTD